MRYHGQGHEIEIELPDRILAERDLDEIKKKFEAEYSRQFSRIVPGMTVEILNWGVSVWSPISHEAKKIRNISDRRVEASAQREIICDVSGKRKKADVFDRASLQAGAQISGPALIVEPQTTTLVSCDFSAVVDGESNIWLTRGGVSPT